MKPDEKAIKLRERVDRFGGSWVVQVSRWGVALVIALPFIPQPLKPDWLKYFYLAYFVMLSIASLHYRFYVSALGMLIASGGAAVSIWYDYDLSGTKRPPNDHITGLILLTGFVLAASEFLVTWLRIRRLPNESIGEPNLS